MSERQVWCGTGIDRVKVIAEAEERARLDGSVTIIHDHGYNRPCRDTCYSLGYQEAEINIKMYKPTTMPVQLSAEPFTALERLLGDMRDVFLALADAVKMSNELCEYNEERADFRDAYDGAMEAVEKLKADLC